MDMEKQKNFKFAIFIEGHSAANRLGNLMRNGFCILYVENLMAHANKLWFSHLLEEGKHYISIRNDLSNLSEQMSYYLDHLDEAAEIAWQGHCLSMNIFQDESVQNYVLSTLFHIEQSTLSNAQNEDDQIGINFSNLTEKYKNFSQNDLFFNFLTTKT